MSISKPATGVTSASGDAPRPGRRPPATSYSPGYVTKLFRSQGIPKPVYEYRFAPPRRSRFDLAWPDHRVAVEVQGGIWTQGRHSRGKGMLADMEKFNNATLTGWRVLLVTPDQLCTTATMDMLRQLLEDTHVS